MSGSRMESAAPTRKVWTGAVISAAVGIIVWAVEAAGVDVPVVVATSMVTVITAVGQYFMPPASDDGIRST